ncbi:MAG TPA: VWA domain-containing protein [Candidatus Limnocylindrales bacterium]|nr:VWA domain-containing protein [Candidatus Limnocylindrales bacterium]
MGASVCRSRRIWRLLLCLGACVTAAAGEWGTRAQEQNSPNSLRATTRTVNVNVVVTDAQGRVVVNLTKEDFTVLDGGQPQRISFFLPIDNERSVAEVTHAAPNTYRNSTGTSPSVTILLFDTLNSKWTSQGYGLNRVRDFLRGVRPEDHIGIYVLGDDLKPVHDFDTDSSDLVAAIHRYDEEHARGAAKPTAAEEESTGDKALDRFISGKDNRYPFELDSVGTGAYRKDKLAFAGQMTTASLEAIARQLSSVQGRKTLIWVTDSIGEMGYFLNDTTDEFLTIWRGRAGTNLPGVPSWENGVDLERMIRTMNAAGIAVYTVDARGLEAERLGLGSRPNEVGDPRSETPQPNGSMMEIAQRTGGRAFFNRNDLETGVRRALDDSRFTYELAYSPDHGKWKGEWRKIQVKVDRPGVTVLARNGYFALPDPQPVPAKDRLEFLSQIAASPIDSTQLPMAVHVGVSNNAKEPEMNATVHLGAETLGSLLSAQANGHLAGHFEIVFMQIGERNKLLDATQKQVDAELKPEEYAAVSRRGWELPVRLSLKAGAMMLCVIVHDEISDEVGSVRIPLEAYAAMVRMQKR